MLDVVRTNMQYLIQHRSGHCPKAMAGHFLLGNSHAAQGAQDSVVAHGAVAGPGTGEDVPTSSCQAVKFLQNGDRLG